MLGYEIVKSGKKGKGAKQAYLEEPLAGKTEVAFFVKTF